jgi:hypothetical protein
MNNANEKQLSCVAAEVGYKTVDTFARKNSRIRESCIQDRGCLRREKYYRAGGLYPTSSAPQEATLMMWSYHGLHTSSLDSGVCRTMFVQHTPTSSGSLLIFHFCMN